MCKKFILLTSLCLVFALAGNAFAATYTWDNEESTNLWRDANNWDGNTLPTAGDQAHIPPAMWGEPNRCIVDALTTALCDDLDVGEGSAVGPPEPKGPCYLYITGGSLTADDTALFGDLPDGYGILTMSGGSMAVIGNGNRLQLGRDNGRGELYMSGGTLSVACDVRCAWNEPNGYAIVELTGDANVVLNRAGNRGDFENRHGYAEITIADNAVLNVDRDFRMADRRGGGLLTMTGGTLNTIRDIQIGLGNNTYHAVDPCAVPPILPCVGVANISGGTINCGRHFQIGQRPINEGTVVRLSGDAVINVETDFRVGRSSNGGIGRFEMTGGTLTIGDDMGVGAGAGCEGHVALNGGTIHISDQFGRGTDANYTRVDVNDYVTITFDGSNMNNIGTWLDNDWLGYGGPDPAKGDPIDGPNDDRHFVYDYNITNVDMTTLTAVPASDINFAQAWHPLPFNGDSFPGDMNGMVELYWTAGDYVGAGDVHAVYFGSELNDVNWYDMNDARIGNDPCFLFQGIQTETSFPVDINLGTDFFWRIDEVNASSPTGYDKGKVWRYHISNYFNVENCESYDGTAPYDPWVEPIEPNSLRYFWRDQSFDQEVYGYLEYHTAEVELHQASPRRNTASMKLKWNNYDIGEYNPTWGYSEAEYAFDDFQNWTVEEVGGLRMDYRGDPGTEYGSPSNVVDQNERLYVVLEDYDGKKAWQYCGEPNDLITDSWSRCFLDLVKFTGVDLNEVNSISVGVGDRGYDQGSSQPVWGIGKVFVDNIRVYPPHCEKDDGFAPYGEFAGWGGGCEVEYEEMRRIANRWLNQDYTRIIPERTGELVGRWKFDETSGNVAADSSGKSHDATLKNMTNASWGHPKPAELPSGTSLFFDPNAGDGSIVDANFGFDYVTVPFSEDFNDVGDDKLGMTWAAWVKTNNDPCARWDWWYADNNDQIGGVNDANFPRVTIIAQADSDPCEMPFGGNVKRLRLSALGALRYQSNGTFRALNTGVEDGGWHHVAVTVEFQTLKDGNDHSSDDTARIYVDGDEEELFGGGDPCDPCNLPSSHGYGYDNRNQQGQADPNNIIVIGGKTGTGAHPFSGWIDDVQIYNRALTADEIVTVKGGGTAPKVTVPEEEVPVNWGSGNNQYNLVSEPQGSRIINFKEFNYMANWWLKETLWPAEPVKP